MNVDRFRYSFRPHLKMYAVIMLGDRVHKGRVMYRQELTGAVEWKRLRNIDEILNVSQKYDEAVIEHGEELVDGLTKLFVKALVIEELE